MYNVKSAQGVFVAESTPGTRIEPTYPTNLNIELFDLSLPSIDTPSESIGTLTNGTFQKGGFVSRERAMGASDFKFYLRGSGDTEVEPLSWEVLASCGYRVVTNGANKELHCDGIPNCQTLSADFNFFTCGATPTGQRFKIRGAVGNAEIGFDSSQSPIYVSVTGMMGAFLGLSDIPAGAISALTAPDTSAVEKSGGYVTTLGGTLCVVNTFKFNPNCEISQEAGNNDEGILKYKHTDMDPTVTMTIKAMPASTFNPYTDLFQDDILSELTIIGGGSAQYDITVENLDLKECQPSDTNGTNSWDLTYSVTDIKFVLK